MNLQGVVFTLALLAANVGWAQTQADFSLPAPSTQSSQSHSLWATHYFVFVAPSAREGRRFKDMKGRSLSDRVAPRDWCLAAIEGTVRVADGKALRTLNYAGVSFVETLNCATVLGIDPKTKPWIRATGKTRFQVARGLYGDGVEGYQLVPYRSIAVDPGLIPIGSVVYIAAARGAPMVLRDGSTLLHDGYFFAADRGGAIVGEHIDVFCGDTQVNCLPTIVGNRATAIFTAQVVVDRAVSDYLTALHR